MAADAAALVEELGRRRLQQRASRYRPPLRRSSAPPSDADGRRERAPPACAPSAVRIEITSRSPILLRPIERASLPPCSSRSRPRPACTSRRTIAASCVSDATASISGVIPRMSLALTSPPASSSASTTSGAAVRADDQQRRQSHQLNVAELHLAGEGVLRVRIGALGQQQFHRREVAVVRPRASAESRPPCWSRPPGRPPSSSSRKLSLSPDSAASASAVSPPVSAALASAPFDSSSRTTSEQPSQAAATISAVRPCLVLRVDVGAVLHQQAHLSQIRRPPKSAAWRRRSSARSRPRPRRSAAGPPPRCRTPAAYIRGVLPRRSRSREVGFFSAAR